MTNVTTQLAAMKIACVQINRDCIVVDFSAHGGKILNCVVGEDLFCRSDFEFVDEDYECFPFESRLRANLASSLTADFEIGITSEATTISWYKVRLVPYDNQFILYFQDINELVGARRLNRQLSVRDPHTGLFYREAFLQEIKTSQCCGTMCCIRICNYQKINDIWGTAVANLVFMDILARVQMEWGYSVCSKHSIDSFNIFVDCGYELDIEKLYNQLNEPYQFNGHSFYSNVALGYYKEKPGDDHEHSLNKAELAILDLLDSRNRLVEFQEELAAKVAYQSRLETTFQQAVTTSAVDQQFETFFQPIHDERLNRLAGAECLMRWKVDGKYISPEEFIPIAERLGEVSKLTFLSIRTIASVLKKLEGSGSDVDIFRYIFAVNISVVELLDVEFVEKISEYIERHGLEPKQIKLELTESAFIDNFNYVNTVLRQLQQKGFRVSIDDFGTGFSSLSYLCGLSFDEIKIDREFVTGVLEDMRIKSVFNTIVSLAQNLGKPVVAEGVEHVEQLAFARAKGVQYVQGFYYSKPVNEEAFLEYLLKEHRDNYHRCL